MSKVKGYKKLFDSMISFVSEKILVNKTEISQFVCDHLTMCIYFVNWSTPWKSSAVIAVPCKLKCDNE